MSKHTSTRSKSKASAKTSGKAKTASAKQKPATGQRGAKKTPLAFDHEVFGLLKQEVAAAAAASTAPPAMPPDHSEKRGKDDLTPTERAYLARHQTEEDNTRRARMLSKKAVRMQHGQTVATNTTAAQLAQDTEALLDFAVRLRLAAEARFNNPPMPGYEDPLVFAHTVAAVLPQLVRATHLLVEFLNVDCDTGGLATQEIAAVRSFMESWPDLYFRHAGAQAIQAEKYKPEKLQIGSRLPWYIHRGKGDPSQSPNVMAAVDTLRFVYANLVRFALQPPGTENDENPLVTWVRTNELIKLCRFVLTMRYAPDKDRRKVMKDMEIECPGWEPPSWLCPTHEDESRREFAGRNWSDDVCYKIVENIEKYQEQLQEDGAVVERRIDFTEWAPELKRILEGGAKPPPPRRSSR